MNDTGDQFEDSGSDSKYVAAADGAPRKGKSMRKEYDRQQIRPAGRKAAKRASKLTSKEEEAEALQASLAASHEAIRSIAQSMAKKAELADAAYQIESRREAIDVLNRPENWHTPEKSSFAL